MELLNIFYLRVGLGILVLGSCLPVHTALAVSPPEELERLKYFQGEWLCRQPADSTEVSGEFNWNVRLGLNDFWYLGKGEQTLTPADGQPINSQEFLGYDSAAKKLIRSVVVGNGNSYNVMADDWQEDSLVWQGIISINGKSVALKQEMVKDSPDRFVTTYFVLDEENQWLPIVNEGCDRNS